mmetsp:Transcript_15259/g.22918  ORF Transcript_15259/g.22918 Transcript_15259/m.22918 type:complete len:880 (-) Transcript_15259:6716-9355(-)
MASQLDLENQSKYLNEAIRKVKEHGFYTKRAMDTNDLSGALNHASDMLRELRTSLLTPKNYYELYMKVLDELRHLDDFFLQLVREGKKTAAELYEQVQACGDVLPRLYLLVTVGSTYIESRQAPAKDILNDLVEMAKGVQHPMRGLFLRNYLATACKDKLPDTGSKFEGRAGGNVTHAVDFILRNFSETNRLWVRMQNQGPSKERKRREKERQDLRILVGTNLVRLSQLEGVDAESYATNILPKLLEQVVNCKDTIAQPYLLDCIIQVFPDEFHLATLDAFLAICTQLKEKVNVRLILESMMKRLAAGAREANSSNKDTESSLHNKTPPHAFQAFTTCANKLLEEKGGNGVDLAELLRLEAAMLEFALECYPGRLDYVNHCFTTCGAILRAAGYIVTEDSSFKLIQDEQEAEQLERVLSLPLQSGTKLGDKEPNAVLKLELLSELSEFLPLRRRKDVALAVVQSILSRPNEKLDTIDKVEQLFAMISPLVKDPKNRAPDTDAKTLSGDARETEQEQLLVAKLTHLFIHPDTDGLFRILGTARRHLGQGGLQRIKYTLVPLVFRALALARQVRGIERLVAEYKEKQKSTEEGETRDTDAQQGDEETTTTEEKEDTTNEQSEKTKEETSTAAEEKEDFAEKKDQEIAVPTPQPQYSSRKVFQFVHEIVTAMAGSFPAISLSLFLDCALEADRCGFKAIAYEFVSQAFILYEDELPDSKAQLKALHLMIGSLLATYNFDETDYDALVTKTTQYAAKMLKKPDQCRMVATASHLFWPSNNDESSSGHRDGRRVLECLQRSLKIADASMSNSTSPGLFVEILDIYLIHFERANPVITPKYISGLVALIQEHIQNMDPGEPRAALQAHYNNTLARIHSKNIIPRD